ncbi:hypothetical protein ACER0C_017100 [Sarotherodon galilaeus]
MQSCYLHQTVQEIRNTPGQGGSESVVEQVRTPLKVTHTYATACVNKRHRRSPNAAGWRKVNRKQKVPMEEVYDICQDPGWAGDSAPPFCRPRVTHRTAVAEVVTTP